MSYYAPGDGNWKEHTSLPDPPYLEVDDKTATLHFVSAPDASVQFTGAPVDPDADTIHTVMWVDPSLGAGAPLCTIYVRGTDLDLEDRRTTDAPSSHANALDQLRSALNEIMIPVYIDDAIEEMSETVDGLIALHTVQHDDGRDAPYTYFRTSVFQNGELLLEEEFGTL
jgi:hypothetical protein